MSKIEYLVQLLTDKENQPHQYVDCSIDLMEAIEKAIDDRVCEWLYYPFDEEYISDCGRTSLAREKYCPDCGHKVKVCK